MQAFPAQVLARLQRWVIPAAFHEQPEALRRARLLTIFVSIILVISIGMTALYLVRGAPAIGIAVGVYCVLSLAPLYILRRTGRLTLAAHTFCGLLWAIFVTVSSMTGGLTAPTVVSHVVIVVMGTLLGGTRMGLIWTAVLLVTYISYEVRGAWGLWIVQSASESLLREARIGEVCASTTAIFLLTLVYERVKDRMLNEINRARQALATAHEQARLVLDNAGQGFVTVDTSGRVVGECSLQSKAWFPDIAEGVDFAELIARVDPNVGMSLRLGFEALREDFLIPELVLEQLPQRLERGEQTLRFDYRRIEGEEAISHLVLVISDISNEVAREKMEAVEREYLAMFQRLLADRTGFFEFVKEVEDLLNQLESPSASHTARRRWLHTIKGTTLLYGLQRIPAICHELETKLRDASEEQSFDLELSELRDGWFELIDKFRPIMSFEASTAVSLTKEEFLRLQQDIERGQGSDDLLHDVRLLAWEPIDVHFRRLAENAHALARRLGKNGLEVVWHGNHLRVKPEPWRPFFSCLVHVIRNAVDHGLQSAEERRQSGQLDPPRLTLVATLHDERLWIEIGDNGRGVDWQRLREKAERLGNGNATARELGELLFLDGLSTRDETSEISGRGIGMGAVRAECSRLSGTILVESELGHGTKIRCSFPLDQVEVGRPRGSIGSQGTTHSNSSTRSLTPPFQAS